jgi:cytochrome c-type biogenesis protein CcmH/NrfF
MQTAYVEIREGSWLLAAAADAAAVIAGVVIAVKRRRRVIEVEPLTEGEETRVRRAAASRASLLNKIFSRSR